MKFWRRFDGQQLSAYGFGLMFVTWTKRWHSEPALSWIGVALLGGCLLLGLFASWRRR